MQRMYQIALHRIVLEAPDNSPVWKSLPNYEPFAVPLCGSAGKALTVSVVDVLEEVSGQKIYDVSSPGFPSISMFRTESGWLIRTSPLPGEPVCCEVLASEDFSRASLRISDLSLARFSVDNALMILFALRTSREDTLEMHSSVTICEGKGYLFLGRSGTGKSTHSRMWLENIPGTELLNDDNPILRYVDGTLRVFGSPWSGKTPCYRALDYPVGAIVRIEQAPFNRITRLSLVPAYASVYPSCSAFREIKSVADAIHGTLVKVASGTPCYTLECLPDAGAAHLCHDTLLPSK